MSNHSINGGLQSDEQQFVTSQPVPIYNSGWAASQKPANPWVVIVENRQLHRECLTNVIEKYLDEVNVESVASESDILTLQFSLLIIGANFSPENGAHWMNLEHFQSRVENLQISYPAIPILVIVDNDDPVLLRKIMLPGVVGVLPTYTSVEIAIAAIRLAMVGGTFAPLACLQPNFIQPLGAEPSSLTALPVQSVPQAPDPDADADDRFTRREGEIIAYLQQGLPNKLIAYQLDISESTVKVHLRNVMKKLNARNRTQALFLMRKANANLTINSVCL